MIVLKRPCDICDEEGRWPEGLCPDCIAYIAKAMAEPDIPVDLDPEEES